MRVNQGKRPLTEFITRDEARKILGVTHSKLRRMQNAGEVAFCRDERGICRFSREEIARLAEERGQGQSLSAGAIAAKAFAMFALGKPWQEVVIALEQTPERVLRLLEQYRGAHAGESRGEETGGEAVLHDEGGSIETWQREQAEALRLAQERYARDQQAWEATHRSASLGALTRDGNTSRPQRLPNGEQEPRDGIGR